MRIFNVLLFVLLYANAWGQTNPYVVKGSIVNDKGIGIFNCNLKITAKHNGLIYSYFNLGEKNNFSVPLKNQLPDTLVIEVSHIGYETITLIRPTKGVNPLVLEIELKTKSTNLQEVEVVAPKTWVRGDTTFFKADAFKEGEERKLKDLLLKMPDFTVNDKGQMLYKRKPIEKISLDNEEIFSDKTELLLNNIPVHILNTVQAIENQSSNKMLKGLDGQNKIFLNLGLTKDTKLKTAFGDGELGIGNRGRYNLAPVIFSMYGKLKMGFIGNYNSIGNGIDWRQANEIKSTDEKLAGSFLMNDYPLSLINNFENKWYIKNQQWDNRFQINKALSERIKSKTEITYLKDKQVQETTYNSSLYTNNAFINRIDSNANTYKPQIFGVKQTFNIKTDSLAELNLITSYYLDRSFGGQRSIYNGFNIANGLNKYTANNWNSFSLLADYTKRINTNKAQNVTLSFSQQFLNQDGTGESKEYAQIFKLNNGFDQLQNNLRSKFFKVNTSWSALIKGENQRIFNFGFTANYTKVNLNHYTNVLNSTDHTFSYQPVLLNDNGVYNIGKVSANLKKSFALVLKQPFQLSANVGLSHINVSEEQNSRNYNNLIIDSQIAHRHAILSVFTGSLNLTYNQMAMDEYRLNAIFYPNGINSFQQYNAITTPLKQLNLNYNLNWYWPKSLSSSSINLSYNKRFNDVLTSNEYISFLQYSNYNLVNQSTDGLNIGVNAQIPTLLLNALINIDAFYFDQNSLVQYNNEVFKNKFGTYGATFSFKKNWDKKYYIRLISRYSASIIKPLPFVQDQVVKKVANWKHSFYQRAVINKQISLISEITYFQNNLNTVNKANFLLADVSFSYKFKNNPLFLSLNASNLTNEKFFYRFSNTALSQSFNSIPLIGRNIYFGATYNF